METGGCKAAAVRNLEERMVRKNDSPYITKVLREAQGTPCQMKDEGYTAGKNKRLIEANVARLTKRSEKVTFTGPQGHNALVDYMLKGAAKMASEVQEKSI